MSQIIKTIHIGKKKKKKTQNFLQELDEFIPRYTSSDVPEHDFLIDNSFELKKYKQKKTSVEVPSPKVEPHKVEPLASKVEPLAPKVEPLTPKVETLTPKVEPLTPKVEPLAPPAPPAPKSKPNPSRTPLQHSIIGNKDHEQNLQHIIEQYKKKKQIHKDSDTDSIHSHSSLIDIMSIADLTSSQLQFITNSSKQYTTYQRPTQPVQPVQPVQQLTNYPHPQSLQSSQTNQNALLSTKKITNNRLYSPTKNMSTYNTHYKKYYNKTYSNDYIRISSLSGSTIQTKKKIKKTHILRMKQQLVTHGIISDIYSDIPEDLLLDLYAMLSDKKCSFTITQL
tara:strand:- start:136 stop:1146 length:1011 start_codon:yes stop_codon:yes gene_type:complete